jgi:hypothetical protein
MAWLCACLPAGNDDRHDGVGCQWTSNNPPVVVVELSPPINAQKRAMEEEFDRSSRTAWPRPRLIHFQMKKGGMWLWAAAASGAVVVLSGVLLWGDGTPQIHNGRGTWGPSIWHLPDGLGLVLLVVVVFGVPWTAFLAFVGVALRLGPRTALWIAGTLLLALLLIL